jgi:MFS family permease
MSNEQKVFHGWWIVVAAAVGLFVGYGPVVSVTFSVFLKPLSAEFSWSRADISFAFAISTGLMAIMLPIIGRFADRFGARKVILPSALVLGTNLILFSLLTSNLWRFYAHYLVIGLISSGTSTMPYSHVISHWFRRKRGLALGLATAGAGVSAFIMPSFAHYLISTIGWREAYILLGIMVLAISIPVVGLFLKDNPSQLGLSPDGDESEADVLENKRLGAEGMTTRQALTSKPFWLMAAAFFFMSVSVHGCMAHLAPILGDLGASAQSAAFAASLFGGALLLGRLVTGYLLDRFPAHYVSALFFLGAGLGIFILWQGLLGPWAFIGAFFVGLGMGAEGDIIPYVLSRQFGLRSFGEIYGYAFAIYILGGVVGPLLMGFSYDKLGSYGAALLSFQIAAVLAGFLMVQFRLFGRTASIGSPTEQKRVEAVVNS